LLHEIVTRARDAGSTRLRYGDQAGNYLAPGLDARDTATRAWLEKRGFVSVGEVENLRVPLGANELVTPTRAQALAADAEAAGYTIRRAIPADAAPLLAMVGVRFAPAWAFEVERALGHDPAGVHIAVAADGEIAAFAAHDGNNRGLGWFGPAGTLEEHRSRGLGAALLIPCLLDVKAAGHEHGVIAWIGPRAFYEKTAGAVADRAFVVLQKDPL
jgi:GNAT superfamily N-acetyltransferase